MEEVRVNSTHRGQGLGTEIFHYAIQGGSCFAANY
ncbi:hypothetical protein [Salmonirosea aquatica]